MIEPDFLAELDRFDTIREPPTSRQGGEHESRDLGEGRTFADYRRYSPGDDTRLVDWKVYARTGELYVKQFEAERNYTTHVLLDASASMDFGDGDENKFDAAARLGLGFAYLAASDNDDFRFSIFGDGVERLDGGVSTRGEVLSLIDRLNETEPAGEAALKRSFEDYAGTIHSRSVVVVASDFLADVDAIDAGLEALSRNDLVLAHVVAPDERDLPTRGDTVFEDLESDRSLRTYAGGRLAREYRSRLDAHLTSVAEVADALRARHAVVDTDEDFFDAFGRVWVA